MPGGLHKVDPSLHKFKVHSHDPNHEASLSNNHVMGIYEAPTAPGKVWLGTRGGGLNSLDLETGLFESFRHKPRDRHSIRSDIVWTTFEDRSGTFWVGTEAGLDTLDRRTGRFSGFKLMESMNTRPATDPIIRIHEDREGRLWLGTWSGGLLRLSRDRAKVKRYVFSTGSQQTFYNSVYALHEDMNGTLWAGVFQGGLFEYDAGSDSFLPHLEAFGATSMLEDSPGIFWVGTINNGLLHYNAASRSLRQFTKEDGLSSNIVIGMLRDENNVIWLSTGNGVARFDPKTGRFTNYGLSDGLPFTSFNHTSAFETLGGQLLFGGVGGLVSFFPDEVRGNPHPPEVVLSGLQIAGAPFALGHR